MSEIQEPTVREESIGLLLFKRFQEVEDYILKIIEAKAPKAYGSIGKAQSIIFVCIDEAYGQELTTSEVAKKVGLSRQAVHKTISSLVDIGLIRLEESPSNKSAKNIVLTEEGERASEQIRLVIKQMEDEISEALGKTNFNQMKQSLAKSWGLSKN